MGGRFASDPGGLGLCDSSARWRGDFLFWAIDPPRTSTSIHEQAYGIIGCFRFLEGYYLLLVSQRRYEGSICGVWGSAPSQTHAGGAVSRYQWC